MDLKEELLNNKRLFTGKIFNLDVEEVRLPNGKQLSGKLYITMEL